MVAREVGEPGRALDAAVAQALGWVELHGEAIPETIRHFVEPVETLTAWTRGADYYCSACGTLPAYSTDDAVALAQCVPWLRSEGYAVTIEYDAQGIRVSAMPDRPEIDCRPSRSVDVPEASGGLAHALCQVVLAIAEGERA